MFVLLRRRLVVKLGALMLATVGVGFVLSAAISARSQRAAMRVQHARAASMFAQGLATGVRSTMLTGDPLATRNFIEGAQHGLAQVHAEVFAPDGDPVFAPPTPPPALSSLPAPRTPVGNLWVDVADKFGVRIERLGESTGRLEL